MFGFVFGLLVAGHVSALSIPGEPLPNFFTREFTRPTQQNVGTALHQHTTTKSDGDLVRFVSKTRIISSLHLDGDTRGITVLDGLAYVANDNGLRIVNITNPKNPIQIGLCANSTWGYVDVNEGFAYVSDKTTNMLVVDARDPPNPRLVGQFNINEISYVTSKDSKNNIVYGATASNSQFAANVSDLTNPEILWKTDPSVLGVVGGWSATFEGLIYFGVQENATWFGVGVRSSTVANSISEVLVPLWDQFPVAGVVSNGVLFTMTTSGIMYALNISKSCDANHRIISSTQLIGNPGDHSDCAGLDIFNHLGFISCPFGLLFADLSDLSNVKQITLSRFGTGPLYDIVVDRQSPFIYMTDRRNGVVVMEYATGNLGRLAFYPALTQIGALPYSSEARIFVNSAGTLVYEAKTNTVTFDVFDVSDPANPLPLGSLFTPVPNTGSVVVQDGYAFVAANCGLNIIDVTDPTNMAFINTVRLDHDCSEFFLFDTFAIVFGANYSSFSILDVTNPMNDVMRMSNGSIPMHAGSVVLSGSFAFVGEFPDFDAWNRGMIGIYQIFVINVTDPRNPLVSRMDYKNMYPIAAITFSEGFLFILDITSCLTILNVDNPIYPTKVAYFEQIRVDTGTGVRVANGFAFIASTHTLTVVDVRDHAHPVEIGHLDFKYPTIGTTGSMIIRNQLAFVATVTAIEDYFACQWEIIYLGRSFQIYPLLSRIAGTGNGPMLFLVELLLVNTETMIEQDSTKMATLAVGIEGDLATTHMTPLPSWCQADIPNRRITLSPPQIQSLSQVRNLTLVFSRPFSMDDLGLFLQRSPCWDTRGCSTKSLAIELIDRGYITQFAHTDNTFVLGPSFDPQGKLLLNCISDCANQILWFLSLYFYQTFAWLDWDYFVSVDTAPVFPQPLQVQFNTSVSNVRVNAMLDFQFRVEDFDGDELNISAVSSPYKTKSAQSLPHWLNFDSSTRRFYGTPSNDAANTQFKILVNVFDGFKSSSDTFEFLVDPAQALPQQPSQTNLVVAIVCSCVAGVVILGVACYYAQSKWREREERKARDQITKGVKQLQHYLDNFRWHKQVKVFISYRWPNIFKPSPDEPDQRRDETTEKLVDQLEKQLESKGHVVLRDKNYIVNGDVVDEFMDLIQHEAIDVVIVVLSSGYFVSDNCMYEFSRIVDQKAKAIWVVNDLAPVDVPRFSRQADVDKLCQFWVHKTQSQQLTKREERISRLALANITTIELTQIMYTNATELRASDFKVIHEKLDLIKNTKQQKQQHNQEESTGQGSGSGTWRQSAKFLFSSCGHCLVRKPNSDSDTGNHSQTELEHLHASFAQPLVSS
eukprot:c9274_g1_i1.p1 GENE.c9274_g1_i1~~c9274_g1_i1.p1  ORF type:complete len:1334 (+),score=189.64 c9274_g1_i1:28-4002(+)